MFHHTVVTVRVIDLFHSQDLKVYVNLGKHEYDSNISGFHFELGLETSS